IGISLSAAGTDPETMIRDADSAMYRAKAKGRARVELFDENMRATVVERLDIESALRRAIARHELRVLYQPTVNLASGKIVGLEITESVIMRDPVASTTALQALKEIGVRIAVDDFGTGYSSLAYLRRFPVDLLKVDQAFVQGLGRDPEDSAIVAAVVSLARTL